jgi:hypothetical protein
MVSINGYTNDVYIRDQPSRSGEDFPLYTFPLPGR